MIKSKKTKKQKRMKRKVQHLLDCVIEQGTKLEAMHNLTKGTSQSVSRLMQDSNARMDGFDNVVRRHNTEIKDLQKQVKQILDILQQQLEMPGDRD